jgi:hypothetical protein
LKGRPSERMAAGFHVRLSPTAETTVNKNGDDITDSDLWAANEKVLPGGGRKRGTPDPAISLGARNFGRFGKRGTKVNWGRGLFRLWLILSALWIAVAR